MKVRVELKESDLMVFDRSDDMFSGDVTHVCQCKYLTFVMFPS